MSFQEEIKTPKPEYSPAAFSIRTRTGDTSSALQTISTEFAI